MIKFIIIMLYALLALFLIYRLIDRWLKITSTMYNNRFDYNEEKIIKHLDYIMDEALQEYALHNIATSDIYYIRTVDENKMIEELQSSIPDRIPPALMAQLSRIYNPDYVGTFIGRRIYYMVTNYVIDFNINNKDANPKNKTQTKSQ